MTNKQSDNNNFQKILFVDDECIFLELIKEVFSDEGINIYTACNGLIALDFIQKNGIDILVTDVRMPELDGFDLATQAKVISPNSKIIFITGFDNIIEMNRKSIKDAGYHILKKPFPIEDIIGLIKKLSAK